MNTNTLKTFARDARVKLLELVGRKIEFVLTHDTAELRGKQEQIGKLRREIERHGKDQVIERIAYIWFNRFMALRFMDANEYNSPKVVSPIAGGTIPEILQEVKAGHIDDPLQIDRQRVNDLLDGKTPSADPQTDAYKLLLVASCNALNSVMPFMFERIADFTELLMPDDLLSDYSIVTDIRNGMSDEDCKHVEIIGWIYQFYISEKKDKVFEDLAKNKKITPENIPAATQLFTPNWIVRYLVENSLGRLWMLNRPKSKLIEKMQYYIKPVEVENDFLKISSPEEIKLCDPACGSGHMLVYAFALLYLIYEEEGYEPAEIPGKILANNLYGIEIDERAGELAAFALTMVAREKYRRFFKKPIQPNICVLEKINFATAQDPNSSTNDLFTNVKWEDKGWRNILDELCKSGIRRDDLLHDLNLFEEADNFGSLVVPQLSPENVSELIVITEELHKSYSQDAFLSALCESILTALKQAEYLSKRYHVVVANPPYMGNRNMGIILRDFLKQHYDDVKADLFSAFIKRNFELTLEKGQLGFMSPFVWMFISQYETLRDSIIKSKTITSLIQLEYSGFEGAVVPICTYTIENFSRPKFLGGYIRLTEFRGAENQAPKTLEAIKNPGCGWFYRANQFDYAKITGHPIAYWVSDAIKNAFDCPPLETITVSDGQNKTGDNDRFVRKSWEVELSSKGV